MNDAEFAALHRRPIGAAGPGSEIRLTITINGDVYQNRLLESWEELEDAGGLRGILFVERDDVELP